MFLIQALITSILVKTLKTFKRLNVPSPISVDASAARVACRPAKGWRDIIANFSYYSNTMPTSWKMGRSMANLLDHSRFPYHSSEAILPPEVVRYQSEHISNERTNGICLQNIVPFSDETKSDIDRPGSWVVIGHKFEALWTIKIWFIILPF